jgi:UDP-N-acetylmuramoyl-L-alanyl-D-glutamate--2,6-diaminopimelate ligase
MMLRALLHDTGGLRVALDGNAEIDVRGVGADSRLVRAGDLFFALRGSQTDGARFVAEACARGAIAVAGPAGLTVPAGVTAVVTDDPARLLARVAARFHGDPSTALTMVGVTGTNGKTTVTYLLEAIWSAAAARPGVLGTISYRFGGVSDPAPLTTPAAPELFARLGRMRDGGATHVAMEVSSHALVQGRAEGIAWDAAVFTNLGRDHLDFHRDADDYFDAKMQLFRALDASPKARRVAVVNAGDARGAQMRARIASPVVTFGAGGDVDARAVAMTLDGTTAEVRLGTTWHPLRTRLVGAGHLENTLAAAATAHALGAAPAAIVAGLADFAGVPGRLEAVATGSGFGVLVDYAHTADALAGVLHSLRELVRGRLICVFGCGGDRDRGKRPLMGEAVGRHADLAVLTSDNPRTEDPLAIIAGAEAGLVGAGMPAIPVATATRGYQVEVDRARAIAIAIAVARADDCVLIAGKGHEDYQIIGTERRAFDDRLVARRALAARAGAPRT